MSDKSESLRDNDEYDHVSAIQRIEQLLWGDKKLGIRGLQCRVTRCEKIVLINTALITVLLLINIADLQLTNGGGLIELLIKGLLGG